MAAPGKFGIPPEREPALRLSNFALGALDVVDQHRWPLEEGIRRRRSTRG